MKLLKRLSNTLTRKWKQFACLHLWDKGDVIEAWWPKGTRREFTCKVCDKKERYWNYFPISGILPSDPWEEYKKDPQMNMRPLIIKIDD